MWGWTYEATRRIKIICILYEGMPVDKDVVNQVATQYQVLVTIDSHTMNVKLHLGTKIHLGVEL